MAVPSESAAHRRVGRRASILVPGRTLGTLTLAAVTLAALWAAPWIGAGNAAASELQAQAAEIIGAKGCKACHYVPGVPGAVGTLGPSLKGIATRGRIAGGRLENTPDNLRDWLRNPKSILSSTMMPNLGLSEEEIAVLVQYFQTI